MSLHVLHISNSQTLVQACAGGDVELFKLMLKQGRDIHEVTEDGESLLCLAASSGYLELCKVLINIIENSVFSYFFYIF